MVFLTNGFETKIIDNQYPERKVSAFYSKRDLEKLFNLQTMKSSLKYITVDKNIAGRYYQEAAIKAVCDSFDIKNRRKALLVMATGSGKTRTVIALCKVLLEQGWIKNILFLADRNSLVTQAKRSFVNLLPDLSVTNLCEEKDNYTAHGVFSTYQTMMNCIDSIHDEEGKLFTCGHFDLVICDEAHRSIYNKYKDIFSYFDAPLIGLTATPKDEIDKNTYEIFELENGVPTYGYELAQAVKDAVQACKISMEQFHEKPVIVSFGGDTEYDELIHQLPKLQAAEIIHIDFPTLPEVEIQGVYAEVTMEKQEWKSRVKEQVKQILKYKPEAVFVGENLFAAYPIVHALRKKHIPVFGLAEKDGQKLIVRIPSGS